MNILYVTNTLDPAWGGPVEGLNNIAAEAVAAGHSIEITCLDSPQAPWIKDSTHPIHAMGQAICGKYGYSYRLDSWLGKNACRFDVLLANGIWMYFSTAVRHAALRARVPYFVFTHGALDPWFRSKYPLKHIKKHMYWTLVEHKVLRDASAVLFTTAEEKAASQSAFWPYRCNPKVVGYGIRDPFTSRLRSTAGSEARHRLQLAFPELGDRRFLLFLARIHEKKGIELLLRAIVSNSRQYQEHAFIIAGPGNRTYLSELQALATELGIEELLIWAGPIYGEMKWSAFQEAEAFILPSHQENFGVSVAEALACRVPVLITNKVNIWREIVSDGGGLAAADNANGICRLLEVWSGLDPTQRACMRERARLCFLNRFNITRTSAVLFDLFAQALTIQNGEVFSECAS